MIVFDRAYNDYHQFAVWSQRQVFFVTRLKKSAVYRVIEVNRVHYRKKGQAKVLRDEIVEPGYHPENENAIRIQVWCTLIARLLMTVIQKIAQTRKTFSVVIALVSRIEVIILLIFPSNSFSANNQLSISSEVEFTFV